MAGLGIPDNVNVGFLHTKTFTQNNLEKQQQKYLVSRSKEALEEAVLS